MVYIHYLGTHIYKIKKSRQKYLYLVLYEYIKCYRTQTDAYEIDINKTDL